ncbi:MAG: cupin domain-containing protein [Dehalococcoidia bacterium]
MAEPVIRDPAKLEWEDADLFKLPAGVRMKLLNEDKETERRDMLVYFPPGYVEPRHVHGGWHIAVLLEGTWIVEGQSLQPGGYFFGPADVEHGPFESPEGCTVFGVMFGDPVHKY